MGSVEFAAEAFGTRLVVVLGHSNCGAIHATLQQLTRPAREQSRNLSSIVDRIRPAVEGLLELLVVGAEYSLETGVVDFFDGVPAPNP